MRNFCLLVLSALLTMSVLPGLTPSSAVAQGRIYCPLPEDGTWVNKTAAPKQLTRLEVETRCENDKVLARIRAFTSCVPRDCKWGWTKAEIREGGGFRVLLIGFLSAKLIDIRAMGDSLDAYVTEISHDPALPDDVKSYTLQRQ
ncbi:hypothetical protein [Roseibium limicola]|nr:hypothetical protein [Roseibium limicola]